VSVADTGPGFDHGRVQAGLGLIGLRERVEALGGVFSISSSPAGSRLTCKLPLITGGSIS
jgi:signal transduction histidine kinase